jgi:hypothetical protein
MLNTIAKYYGKNFPRDLSPPRGEYTLTGRDIPDDQKTLLNRGILSMFEDHEHDSESLMKFKHFLDLVTSVCFKGTSDNQGVTITVKLLTMDIKNALEENSREENQKRYLMTKVKQDAPEPTIQDDQFVMNYESVFVRTSFDGESIMTGAYGSLIDIYEYRGMYLVSSATAQLLRVLIHTHREIRLLALAMNDGHYPVGNLQECSKALQEIYYDFNALYKGDAEFTIRGAATFFKECGISMECPDEHLDIRPKYLLRVGDKTVDLCDGRRCDVSTLRNMVRSAVTLFFKSHSVDFTWDRHHKYERAFVLRFQSSVYNGNVHNAMLSNIAVLARDVDITKRWRWLQRLLFYKAHDYKTFFTDKVKKSLEQYYRDVNTGTDLTDDFNSLDDPAAFTLHSFRVDGVQYIAHIIFDKLDPQFNIQETMSYCPGVCGQYEGAKSIAKFPVGGHSSGVGENLFSRYLLYAVYPTTFKDMEFYFGDEKLTLSTTPAVFESDVSDRMTILKSAFEFLNATNVAKLTELRHELRNVKGSSGYKPIHGILYEALQLNTKSKGPNAFTKWPTFTRFMERLSEVFPTYESSRVVVNQILQDKVLMEIAETLRS